MIERDPCPLVVPEIIDCSSYELPATLRVLLLMIEILHDVIYKNVGIVVLQHLLSHEGFLSSAAGPHQDRYRIMGLCAWVRGTMAPIATKSR